MKQVIAAILFFSGVIASASCPQVTGKYLCPKEAASELALGAQDVSIESREHINSYIFAIGKSDVLFELDGWNPAISTNGDIDFNVRTMATCSDDKMTLKSEIKQREDGISLTINQDYEITPSQTGINLRVLLDGDEFYNFACTSALPTK